MSEWEIHQGHVLDRLADMPAASVQTCITSPPYFGLRDYGTADWEGGDPDCKHRIGSARRGVRHGADASVCSICGAVRLDEQIGIERTPDEYVAKLVAVFEGVARVLRADGTLWLNLGDCYNAYNGNSGPGSSIDGPGKARNTQRPALATGHGLRVSTLKPKDLIGTPWMAAFALREAGWFLRKCIIWHKPNPMPESVYDRPTSAHEYVFLLTRSERYFYDYVAIMEEDSGAPAGNGFAGRLDHRISGGLAVGGTTERWTPGGGRNKRDVWTIPTQPFPEAHFATFPPDLVLPMILAGSSPQACEACGAPWERVTERVDQGHDGSKYGERAVAATGGAISGGTEHSTLGSSNGKLTGKIRTVGWQPTCEHENEGTGRCRVLDPFAGAGTTLKVAVERGRHGVGIELNPEYVALARRRLSGVTMPLFADV